MKFQCILIACLLGSSLPATEGARVDVAQGWALLRTFRADAAFRVFERIQGDEARYGEALALLAKQPATQGNLRSAEEMLTLLAGNDESPFQPHALYFLARIAQAHQQPPDPGEALRRYSRLLDSHPEHELAQLAEVKAAILRLYVLPHPDTDDGTSDLFDQLEARAAKLQDPDAIRDFYWVLSDAAAHYELDRNRIFHYLKKIDGTQRTGGNLKADLLVQLAENALALGRTDEAQIYSSRFLEEFPQNNRAHMIRMQLRTLRVED